MKMKKGTLAILMLLAISVLGIGYALAPANLKINGTLGVSANDTNFQVAFLSASGSADNATVSGTVTPTVSAAVDGTNKQLATFTVTGFTSVGDKVDLTYVIKNSSKDLTANVTATALTTFEYSNYFKVTPKFGDSNTTTIAAGGDATLTVSVECIKTPTATVENKTTEGIITIQATAVEKAN